MFAIKCFFSMLTYSIHLSDFYFTYNSFSQAIPIKGGLDFQKITNNTRELSLISHTIHWKEKHKPFVTVGHISHNEMDTSHLQAILALPS